MAGRESKYERVEKVKVDNNGHAQVKNVGEDFGKSDPGMNFQDKGLVDVAPLAYAGSLPEVERRRTGSINSNDSSSRGRTSPNTSLASGFVEPRLAKPLTGQPIISSTGEFSSSSVSRTDSGLGNSRGKLDQETVVREDLRKPEYYNSEREFSKMENEVRRSGREVVRNPELGREGEFLQQESSEVRRSGRNPEFESEREFVNQENPVRPRLGSASDSSMYGSRAVGSAGVTTQRTTVVRSEQVEGLNELRSVPIVPHSQHEEREVIQHETRSRSPQTTIITVPSTRFESAKLESTRTGVTYTEDKPLTIPAPMVAPQIEMHQQMTLGTGTHAEIHSSSNMHLTSEAAQLKDMGPEEYARYRAKVEELARQHEMQVSQKAAAYRSEVERDAELIRQTLERQHIRDIEFRKDLVESAVDRQQVEIQLEAEYAMRALEQEREAARAALDQAKMNSNIDVNIDSAIGVTHSQGKMTTTGERHMEATRARVDSSTRI